MGKELELIRKINSVTNNILIVFELEQGEESLSR